MAINKPTRYRVGLSDITYDKTYYTNIVDLEAANPPELTCLTSTLF